MDSTEFLPTLRSNIMDELLVTEGMLFKDETAKLFYIDIKNSVFLKLNDLWNEKDTYLENLSQLCKSNDQLSTITKFSNDNFAKVAVLYATYLFSKDAEIPVKIKKPQLEKLLQGIYKRIFNVPHIRNGSFFEMDPLRQDFMFRETFRVSLSDCIEILEDLPVENVSSVQQDVKLFVGEDVREEFVDDIKPDDSVSNFMPHSDTHYLTAHNTSSKLSVVKSVIKDNDSVSKSIVNESATVKDAATSVSKSTKLTYTSTFSKPKLVRTVKLEEPLESKLDTA